MRLSIRKAFATLLLIAALVPALLVAQFHVGDPATLYAAAHFGGTWLGRLSWTLLGAFVIGVLIYPPFLPFLRMRIRATWRRLGTDRGPLYEGVARLRHLETHADRLLVGRMARQLGDTALAIENLTRAYELDPTHISGRFQLALLLAELGQREDAVKLLITVVHDDEKHAFGDAILHLGRNLFRIHRDAEALGVLRRHQELFPGSRQVHLLVARVLADMGQLDEAKQELALAARPPDDGELLTAEDNLARTRAKVTFLKKGSQAS